MVPPEELEEIVGREEGGSKSGPWWAAASGQTSACDLAPRPGSRDPSPLWKLLGEYSGWDTTEALMPPRPSLLQELALLTQSHPPPFSCVERETLEH